MVKLISGAVHYELLTQPISAADNKAISAQSLNHMHVGSCVISPF